MSTGEFPVPLIPTGPATPQEIWANTIDVLKAAPAAYQGSQITTRLCGNLDVLTSLWAFHDYDAENNTWQHIAVCGDSRFEDVDPEVRRALAHFNAKGRELTTREQKAGLLGFSAVSSLFGKSVDFPYRDLLFETLARVPDCLDQLTIQTRAGFGEQVKLHDAYEEPILLLDNPGKPGRLPGGTSFRERQAEEPAAFAALLELNGEMEKLLPNFGRSKYNELPMAKR